MKKTDKRSYSAALFRTSNDKKWILRKKSEY